MKRVWLFLIPLVALIGWLFARESGPIEVPFTKVTRETLISTLNTNGKVEPVEWSAVRAQGSGAIQAIHVQRGEAVVRGQLLVTLNADAARAELSSAQSKIMQSRAELATLSGGGRAPEQAEIESGLVRARADLANAKREQATLERLIAKRAATQAELTAARQAVQRAEMQIESLERRRGSLVTEPDRSAAQARLEEAQGGAMAAQKRIEAAGIRSPMAGIVYDLPVHAGGYVNPGDLIAHVGKLNQLRVMVYVDEPELGRVEKGMPVTITWDAMPDRRWNGTVETVPLQVIPLGTRQVGEVICTIENPDMSLIPGTNVNAEIRSRVVQGALTLPKEALRREGNETGVLKLEGDKVVWRSVRLGETSVTRVQILDGISEGDAIALQMDQPLKSGDRVTPVFRQ